MPFSPAPFTESDIASMLASIPPRPDYSTWIKISSAVFSALPHHAAAKLLAAWSPEEREGEYDEKGKHRCKRIGIGSLVMIAKQHGWRGSRPAHRDRRAAPDPIPTRRNSTPPWIQKLRVARQAEPDRAEAERIARELLKAHDAGCIDNDSDARLFAKAIHLFGARVETMKGASA